MMAIPPQTVEKPKNEQQAQRGIVYPRLKTKRAAVQFRQTGGAGNPITGPHAGGVVYHDDQENKTEVIAHIFEVADQGHHEDQKKTTPAPRAEPTGGSVQ